MRVASRVRKVSAHPASAAAAKSLRRHRSHRAPERRPARGFDVEPFDDDADIGFDTRAEIERLVGVETLDQY